MAALIGFIWAYKTVGFRPEEGGGGTIGGVLISPGQTQALTRQHPQTCTGDKPTAWTSAVLESN